ncbi:hypothetical protein DXV76_08350 [Rhodobacteraceae bacterium CCMM004]|nr:hypothetical protein DXV76_08350 [Rhodobacteraceae bacterium CCMM004]
MPKPNPPSHSATVPLPPGFPAPSETYGMAAPGYSFPGPGWTGPFRTRPSNDFDLGGKLHDLLYCVNGVDLENARPGMASLGGLARLFGYEFLRRLSLPTLLFGTGIDERVRAALDDALAQQQPPKRDETMMRVSRLSKADWIFRRLNASSAARSSVYASAMDGISQTFFLDRDSDRDQYWISGDGFRNVLADPACKAALNRPAVYLMIPYAALRPPRPRLTRIEHGKYASHEITSEDLLTQHPDDVAPGFLKWFESVYRDTFQAVTAVTSKVGRTQTPGARPL